MNDIYAARLLEAMERVAIALESSDEHHTPEQIERMLTIQERQVAISEQRLEIERQHNEMHLRGIAHEQS